MRDSEKCNSLIMGDLAAKVPVVQGGMGVGISLSGLAGAVALHGGIGTISAAQIGFREPDFCSNPLAANLRALAQEIAKAKEISNGGIIAVNIMAASKFYDRYVRTAVEAGVDMIVSGAGIPASLPKMTEGFRTKIAPIVSSVKSAAVLCKLWDRKYQRVPDMIVFEGPEAGGHLGYSYEQLEQLAHYDYEEQLKAIVSCVHEYEQKYQRIIPVIAAGGIYTRADMEKCLAAGAKGVQIGTRFVTTEECDAAPEYKQKYIDARAEDIRVMKSPVGMPGRAIQNHFLEKAENKKQKITKCYQCLLKCEPNNIPFCITEALVNAANGRCDEGLLFCGSNAYRAAKIESVKGIMTEFV